MKLDLNTLKHIKLIFDIHSDMSSRCNGYNDLCRIIDEEEKKQRSAESSCKCKGGPKGRTVTEDFEHQVCDKCGRISK